jgi:hypothetical protein
VERGKMTLPIPLTFTQKDAYAKYQEFNQFSYNCIKYLMNNNELIWKLIYYTGNDAWNQSNLSMDQKASLIYNGKDDATNFRVFLDTGQYDVWTNEVCLIRIWPYVMVGRNRTVGTIVMCMEVYAHTKINTLSNYTTRIDTIIQQFLEVFNGQQVGGLGALFFDKLADSSDKVWSGGSTPFKSKGVYFSNHTS